LQFEAPTESVHGLHPRIVQGLLAANERFTSERPYLPAQHVFRKQDGVNPRITRYFILADVRDARRARGLGMLIDGTRGERTALEVEFPHKDFRNRPGEQEPVELMEVARLAVAASERGGLRTVFQAMAAHLIERYGGEDRVPANLRIVLWTSEQGLMERYRDRYGFHEWESPESLGREDTWVMGMTAAEFLKENRVKIGE
jgi:hypothetical protein